MYRYLAIGYFVALVFVILCVWIPPYDLDKEDEIRMPWTIEQPVNEKLNAALKSNYFSYSYVMVFLTFIYFTYIGVNFKPFGGSVGHNDMFLTFAYTIA
jgi:hypothetical protein